MYLVLWLLQFSLVLHLIILHELKPMISSCLRLWYLCKVNVMINYQFYLRVTLGSKLKHLIVTYTLSTNKEHINMIKSEQWKQRLRKLTTAVSSVCDDHFIHAVVISQIHSPPGILYILCMCAGSTSPLWILVSINSTAGCSSIANGMLEGRATKSNINRLRFYKNINRWSIIM